MIGKHVTRRGWLSLGTALLLAPYNAEARETWAPVRVAGVDQSDAIRLEDGRVLRLAGIAVPMLDGRGRALSIARQAEALLASLSGAPDLTAMVLGWDRHRQPVGLLRRGDGTLVQAQLVRGGLALRWSQGLEVPASLEQDEAAAREERAGLWSPEARFVEQADEVATKPLRLALVEGQVSAVGSSADWTYLNFGADRRRDFTCKVGAGQRRAFARAGLDLAGLQGKRLRVRGWVTEEGGPLIEAGWPDQVERIDEPG